MKSGEDMAAFGSAESHEKRVETLRKLRGKPNILLLITDQQRFDTIRACGFSHMITPTMDRLVQEGICYENAYSPNPICMPARYNLLTGLTARFHGYADNSWGIGMPAGIATLPQILSDNGYETHTIGKNHFYPPRRHNGYERMELMSEVPAYREQDDYAMYLGQVGLGHIQNIHGVRNLLYMVPQRSLIPEEHHGTKWVADRAIAFLEANRGRLPFLLKVSWIAPHPPFDVVDEYADLYRGVQFPDPRTSTTPVSPLARESMLLGDLPSPAYLQRMKELYSASISHVDAQLGRILDKLEETRLADNTIVIFTSDHGEMLGDYGTYQKWLPYDSCARVPFIMRLPPALEAEVAPEQFVDWNDILPTLLDAVGIEHPRDYPLAGESLLRHPRRRDRTVQYMEYSSGNRRWISLRDSRYKYNYYYGGACEELFDLQEDPTESENLLVTVADAETREIRKALHERLLKHEEVWGLAGYVTDGHFAQFDDYRERPYRNKAFPLFPEMIMNPADRSRMNSFFEEVITAIAGEPVVHLRELDLRTWQQNGGFTDRQIEALLEAETKMRSRH